MAAHFSCAHCARTMRFFEVNDFANYNPIISEESPVVVPKFSLSNGEKLRQATFARY